MENKLYIEVKLREPTGGFWDGGAKSYFVFKIDNIEQDEKGYYAKIGSYDANFFFTVSAGVGHQLSERAILTNALKTNYFRKLKQLGNVQIVPYE